jgi:hypothetical protein
MEDNKVPPQNLRAISQAPDLDINNIEEIKKLALKKH